MKKLQDSGTGKNPKEDVKRKAERQPVPGLLNERDERSEPKPSVPEVSFEETPQRVDNRKGGKIPARSKKWKHTQEERDGLVIALIVQMEELSSVSKDVLLMNHLDRHVHELEAATKDNLKKVIERVKQCRCQEPKTKKEETPKPRIGQRRLKKLMAEKRRLLKALYVQVEGLEPVKENVYMIYHLDGHILDLQLAGKGAMGAVLEETKNCKCQAYREDNGKGKENRKWKKLIDKSNDLIYELMVQVERIDPTSANFEAIAHLEGHIWDLEEAENVELKSKIKNTRKCSCQAALPKKKKKPRYRKRDWQNLLIERNTLIEELSGQLKALDGNSEDYLFMIVHLQKHQWLLQRAKVEDMEFLVGKVQKCWCQKHGTDEPESSTQEMQSLIETSSNHDSDTENSSYHEFEDRPDEFHYESGDITEEFHYESGDITEEFHYESGESSQETPVTPKSLLLKELERVKMELIQKLNKWDEVIETKTAKEQLSNERRALLVEREHFNDEKKDLEIQRKEFEERKQALELDYFTTREEIDRQREDLMKEQEILRWEWEAFQIEMGAFCLEMTNKREELRKEKEALFMDQHIPYTDRQALDLDWEVFQREKEAFEKERENLILEREKHEKNVREFNSRKEKIRKDLEAAGAKLITEKKLIDEDRFLLKKEKELLQRKSDNFTKEKTEFPREPKTQCKNEWKKQQGNKVGNLERRLVELESQLNILEAKTPD
ncbi:centrosomal protein of 290 kDa-like [Macrobrachium nipponense]|uniref:centrosomal protein of 290 kDa-like n=1 Tax=Macrobrachium nipponense TaxID=159736 RepID=UPI0030C7C82B